jgi:cytochrome c peroxidase
VLGRATPSIYNSAYNGIQMWDGRKANLEEQALGPLSSPDEMAADFGSLFVWLQSNHAYSKMFAQAYPNEPIGAETLAKAIASYERTVVSNNSPFDRWLQGEPGAMTPQQVRGFRVFADAQKGNCAACHHAPNFTDDGFHNIGLKSFASDNPDLGRYAHRPVKLLKGAFKTPGLRNIAQTAPYFHDGSAQTLAEVVDHYVRGGDVHTNLSPNMKALALTPREKADLVAFLQALTGDPQPVVLPVLP